VAKKKPVSSAKMKNRKRRGITQMNESHRRTATDFLFARPSFVSGVARLVDFGCVFDQYNISRSQLEADIRASVSDWLSVGDDIQSTIDAVDDEERAA
jgi:hypothetical protein